MAGDLTMALIHVYVLFTAPTTTPPCTDKPGVDCHMLDKSLNLHAAGSSFYLIKL